MVVRARSFAAIAIATLPFAGAQSALASSVPPAAGTPSFNCNAAAAGGSIDWGNKTSLTPYLGLGSSSSELKYDLLGCSDNKFSSALGDAAYFQIKFWDATSQFKYDDRNPFEVKFEDKTNSDGYKFSLWDVTLNFLKYDDAGNVSEYKEFIGIQVSSQLKFVDDGALKITDGVLYFDPTNPGGNAEVSFYATPQATPEPGSLILLGTGLLGMGATLRRRVRW
jgi:hypothetical protein